MNELQPTIDSAIDSAIDSGALTANLNQWPLRACLGPAILTVTDTALIVSVGPSRLILTAEGIVLDAPRIDLNPEEIHS